MEKIKIEINGQITLAFNGIIEVTKDQLEMLYKASATWLTDYNNDKELDETFSFILDEFLEDSYPEEAEILYINELNESNI